MTEEIVRKRNLGKNSEVSAAEEVTERSLPTKSTHMLDLNAGSYWLTRILLLRSVSFVFFVAFLVALQQNEALIGRAGLLPGRQHLSHLEDHLGRDASAWQKMEAAPTVLWFMDYEQDFDFKLKILQYSGLVLSAFVFISGSANIPLMLVIWILYHSVVNVGQQWYSFGWESQLLETGFLAAFLCPLLSLKPVPQGTPTSFIVILGFRWIIFRIMIGAGLIKIRGDQCWRDLTCMNYHYETQPVPNPISYYLHQTPEAFHWFETAGNHFVELIAPFFLLLNRRMRIIGGIIQVLFQVVLIISGNLSFLNWLTIIPALACFDDKSIAWMFSSKRGAVKYQVWLLQQIHRSTTPPRKHLSNYIRTVLNISLGVLIVYLSYPVVTNLISSRQRMNTSFEPLRIVNTYGAFGSITKDRTEVIFQGTYADNPNDPNAEWFEYEFKCKPGRTDRRPCLISPYHYRLDWLMWFAAFQNYQYNPWLVHLAAKLLVNDEATSQLIAYNPFEGKAPPAYVRAEHYRYRYTAIGSSQAGDGHWWSRTHQGSYLPPVNVQSLEAFLKQRGWYSPDKQSSKSGPVRKKRI